MINNYIKLGGVYSLNNIESPIRILLFDNIEVHYDAWWKHTQSWGLTNLKGSTIYYRISFDYFINNSKYLRTDPLNENEINTHRPDLPIRLCRFSNISWKKHQFQTQNEYDNYLLENDINFNDLEKLNIPSIYIEPYGPKGGPKGLLKIESSNKNVISPNELLFKANNIQSKYINEEIIGVGIYRSGFKNKIPSYYIGNFQDKAGFVQST